MLKKTILTAAAVLAITAGATTISAPDANASANSNNRYDNNISFFCHKHGSKAALVLNPAHYGHQNRPRTYQNRLRKSRPSKPRPCHFHQ